ncbi:hypothetical protein [Zhihengliuella salsuginis]|uniref:SatD family (SatD) n=1 Tax=Zhihengliuella salsuginis TaxID=578222 RepID=A0ABQ3GLK3_9MICC|nr:hypothetical protein [Zhihengliuella salsuginis]GHD10925.1 hypothetical protein GCM10008096_24980 [Zhihengliuella salsuginis]
MYVVTINQRDTRDAGDRVDELTHALRDLPAAMTFQRSLGDETIGILDDPAHALTAALIALRQRRWNVGIGAGTLHEPLPGALDDVRGPALVHARRAVTRAQRIDAARATTAPLKPGERLPVAVAGADPGAAEQAEAVIRLLGRLVAARSQAEWAVVDLFVPGVRGQQKEIGAALGISSQAVSKAILRSHAEDEAAARPAAAALLRAAAG